MLKVETRSERVSVRLTPSAKQKLHRAAVAANCSVSDFVLKSALIRADETFADRQQFRLSAEEWTALRVALDAPPRHHVRLGRLLNEPSIFEQHTSV
jgi:uncharacterized protein (DUF1778 family)